MTKNAAPRLSDQEKARWAKILEDNRKTIASIAHGFFRNRTTSEDAIQQIKLRILENCGHLRTNENIPGWIATVVRNYCTNHLQSTGYRRGRWTIPFPEQIPQRGTGVLQRLVRTEGLERIRNAMQAPPPRQHATIIYALNEKTHKDLARDAGIPIGSSLSARSRAMDSLRSALNPSSPTERCKQAGKRRTAV